MSLKSLLGMKERKVKDVEGASKPTVPTVREMLQDIENIKKNDPILTLAAIINKNNTGRHSVVDSDIKELMEALQRRKRRESQSSSSSHNPLYSNFKNSKQMRMSASEGGKEEVVLEDEQEEVFNNKDNTTEDTSFSGERNKLTYDKLKHFLTTCEHSQELIESLEKDLRRLQVEVEEHYVRHQGVQRDHKLPHDLEESNLL